MSAHAVLIVFGDTCRYVRNKKKRLHFLGFSHSAASTFQQTEAQSERQTNTVPYTKTQQNRKKDVVLEVVSGSRREPERNGAAKQEGTTEATVRIIRKGLL